MSLSVWRVWIEIIMLQQNPKVCLSLSVWRVWIEISRNTNSRGGGGGHSLYGECGLKWVF